MSSNVRRFRITGMDNGYPITPYIVVGDIDYHLNCRGDCARYYEELTEGELTDSEVFDLIIELEIATYEELNLITGINGYNLDALNDVIYYRTGYRDIEQYLECEA